MNFLKKLREGAGLSQAEIAKKMNYSTPQFISNWEREVSYPPLNSIKKLASILGVSPDLILDYVEEKERAQLEAKFKAIRKTF